MTMSAHACHNMVGDQACSSAAFLLEHVEQAVPERLGELAAMQDVLADLVVEQPLTEFPEFVCGVDVSYSGENFVASAATLAVADGRVEEESYVTGRAGFPYIPGYFAYREVWALFHVVQDLRKRPDVVLCDGNGRLHQRRCGVACYLGILLAAPVFLFQRTLREA